MSLIKLAAPRWFKEIKKNPALIDEMVGKGSSVLGTAAVKGMKQNLKRNSFEFFKRNENALDSLPISNPFRRNLYFKSNKGQIYKGGLSITEENLKHITPAHIDMTKTKKFVDKGMKGKSSRHINSFRALNSNKVIPVTHITNDKNSLLTQPIRTPSALASRMNVNNIFTFPTRSSDLRQYTKGLTKAQAKKEFGVTRLTSHIRESDVIYKANETVRPKYARNPEIAVPGHKFIEGLKR